MTPEELCEAHCPHGHTLRAERNAARAEAQRLREALERLIRNQHAPASLADAFAKACAVLATTEKQA